MDLSIFSPLKAAYRKELYTLSSLIDSTPIGKRNFLLCYQKARKASITPSNIKAGWKASGLWPVSAAKPLMSQLLLENNNKPIKSTSQETPTLLLEPLITPLPFSTPKGRRDLHLGLRTLANSSHDQLLTQRVLFKKITKGFDKKDFELGEANMRIKELEARLEQLKPRKRRKVQTSPNSKFAITRAI